MDQFRQVGEVLGSLKALMVLKHEISINKRQCCLLFDMLELAFDTISGEIRQNLRLEERSTKWKALELPLKELHRIFKEADLYIRQCMDVRDWWGRAISLHMNRDCLELHIHNLLCCFTVVIEAIETAAEISGADQDDMQKKRIALMQKYDQECDDPKFFLWKFGKQYLLPREICSRLETAWREDRWLLLEKVADKKMIALENSARYELRLVELLVKKLSDVEASNGKILPSNVLGGASDYFIRRRLGSGYAAGGGHVKEIHWLGENFALRTFYGDISPPLQTEISTVLSLSHPNVVQNLCAFYDEDRKEGFLVMELMSKDLGTYIKENCSQRNRIPFSIPVAVDIMLQIARGLEYLHSKGVYHGELTPSSILLKPRNSAIGGFQVKLTGFALRSIKRHGSRCSTQPEVDLDIWSAPEVLTELEQHGNKSTNKYTEKADVYSFAMLCFELLTGKVPFEDSHLQGEKMARNIRAGERPLFSYPSPKYLANMTKKCWQTNPNVRPSFSSICRILRYIKKVLVINPDHGQPDSPPPFVDYCDMEAGFLKKVQVEGNEDLSPVLQIPFQMFTYKVVEKEKICGKKWEDGSVPASVFDEEQLAAMDDFFLVPCDRRSVCSEIIDSRNSAVGMDARSVISEIPHRKLYKYDQRSIGSESPGRFSSSIAGATDRRPMSVGTPERNSMWVMDQRSPKFHQQRSFGSESPGRYSTSASAYDQRPMSVGTQEMSNVWIMDQRSPKVSVPDRLIIASKASDSKQISPKPQDNCRSPLSRVPEERSERNEILEKRQSLRPIVENDENTEILEKRQPLRPIVENDENTEILEKRQSLRSIYESRENTELLEKKQSLRPIVENETCSSESLEPSSEGKTTPTQDTECRKLSESSEKELQNDPNEASVSFATSEEKTESIHKSNEKSDNPETPKKKPWLSRKWKDMKTKKVPETPKSDSTKSSSVKTRKTRPIFSPAASPSRLFGNFGYSGITKDESPKSSPTRIKKKLPIFSLASSPSRAFKSFRKSEATNSESSSCSPARIKKTRPIFSPASSPSRTFKNFGHSEATKSESSSCSSARMKKPKSIFSPASSPSRISKNFGHSEAAKSESLSCSPARTKKPKSIFSPASSPSIISKNFGHSEASTSESLSRSPARMKKSKSIFSPASSPARVSRNFGYSEASTSESLGCSPARVKKSKSIFSPTSSPARVSKNFGYSETPRSESPSCSPARMKKTKPVFSPASSPSRTFTTCSSPQHHPSAFHSKELTSPMSSPLNPCSRCSRLSRPSSVQASSDPRTTIDHKVTTQVQTVEVVVGVSAFQNVSSHS